jgi:glutaminase
MCERARRGKLESLEDMLRNGANPNVADYDGRTPLHVAAADGHKMIVQMLLSLGCQADLPDRWGSTARQEAVRAGHAWPDSVWGGGGAPQAVPVP